MKSLREIFGPLIDVDFVPKSQLELERKKFLSATQNYIDIVRDLKKEIERLSNRRFCFVVTFEDNSEETIQADGFNCGGSILSFYANERDHRLPFVDKHDVYVTKKKWKKINEIKIDD